MTPAVSAPTPVCNPDDPPANSFVLRRQRVVYLSTTKNASTALRWMVADLAGEDFARFHRSAKPHQSRLMTIHTDREVWQRVPTLRDLPAAELSEVSRDNGWFVFAVCRDPWSRMWSSWQSKLLVRQGGYVEGNIGESWFPRLPDTAQDVIEDWRRFVAARPWRDGGTLATNAHFLPQARAIHPKHVNYTRVYDLTRLSTLIADLRTHLDSLGETRPLYLPRANESPLPLVAEALDEETVATIRRAMRLDFRTLPRTLTNAWAPPTAPSATQAWTADGVRIVRWRAESNERIAELSGEIRAITRSRPSQLAARARRVRDRLRP